MRHCLHPRMKEARAEIIQEAEEAILLLKDPADAICVELLALAQDQHPNNLRLWTGLWDGELTKQVELKIGLIKARTSQDAVMATKTTMILFLRILAEGLLHLWSMWSATVLPSHPSMVKIHKLDTAQEARNLKNLQPYQSNFKIQLEANQARSRQIRQERKNLKLKGKQIKSDEPKMKSRSRKAENNSIRTKGTQVKLSSAEIENQISIRAQQQTLFDFFPKAVGKKPEPRTGMG